jgi:hypothetical protein
MYKLLQPLYSLNNSKFFAGLVMIMLNIGSKYVTIELSKTQEQYLKNSIARQFLIFSIVWLGTKDVITSLGLTAVFIILTQYLFNENSSFCVLPKHIVEMSKYIDKNNDGEISEDEINNAIHLLQKAKKKEQKQRELKMFEVFRNREYNFSQTI